MAVKILVEVLWVVTPCSVMEDTDVSDVHATHISEVTSIIYFLIISVSELYNGIRLGQK
jgi:hypothetical protein